MGPIRKKAKAKSEATRQALLHSAVKIIGSRGYTAATIDAIAEDAGVSKGVVYYYFKTKADIATQVLVSVCRDLVTRFERDIAEIRSPYDAMCAIIKDFANLIFDNREAARFVLTELWRQDRLWSGEMREQEERLSAVIGELLQRGIDEGRVRPEIDLQFTAAALTGTVLITAQFYLLNDKTPDVENFSALCIDHIQHALAVPGTLAS
ncbi:MAG: TetR/AcrR family transcriptional regulator [Coriobacteriia bacterium]|nr:TetR/AcrR family transcriptional regulator [Coriobacteriia bacterium]